MVEQFGLEMVEAYMGHVRSNAAERVRRVIDRLKSGHFVQKMDSGAEIHVRIVVDSGARRATIDFHGTSPQVADNFNAPSSIVQAAVLYVFRTLVKEDIPLNDGCLEALDIVIPEGSMLAPKSPAAVVAGNVETSQAITNALYGALNVLAASQGTMNNLTFGNSRYQYYETICGGAGAGPGFAGASAVHTHMTNTRLTDPEILESRYPVQLEAFRDPARFWRRRALARRRGCLSPDPLSRTDERGYSSQFSAGAAVWFGRRRFWSNRQDLYPPQRRTGRRARELLRKPRLRPGT